MTLVPKTGLLPFLHRFPYYTTRNASWYEYTPGEVKLAVTGYGAARKEQIGYMVRQLLHLPAVPKPDDAADAAAIAICHAHMFRLSTTNAVK